MTGFIVSGFPFRNRVSSTEAFEGLELGEGKLSRPVLRGPGGRKAAWLLGSNPESHKLSGQVPANAVSVHVGFQVSDYPHELTRQADTLPEHFQESDLLLLLTLVVASGKA